MKNPWSLIIFIITLVIIPLFALKTYDIPISVDQNNLNTEPIEFDHKYLIFSRVGMRLKDQLIKIFSKFVNQNTLANSYCLVPPIKQPGSLKRKMDLELKLKKKSGYLYKDFEDVKDFVRSSLIFSSKDEILQASYYLEDRFGKILKKDDTFDVEKSPLGKGKTGYRDLSYNFLLNETIFALSINKSVSEKEEVGPYYMKFEVQLHLCGIFLAKQIGHHIYEMTRILSQISGEHNFESLIPQEKEGSFLKIFDHIQKILPENEESASIIDSFDLWNLEKNNPNLIKHFLDKLKKLSLEIYNTAIEADQTLCIEQLGEIINNKKCEFRVSAEDLDEISNNFVKGILT